MLDLFRKRGVMSVVYTSMMGALILVFVIQFRAQGPAESSASPFSKKCVAKVRGTCIEEKAWKVQLYLLRGMIGPGLGETAINWKKLATDSLVERTLLEQEADRYGIRVNEDDVMHELIRGRIYVMLPMAQRPMFQRPGSSPYPGYLQQRPPADAKGKPQGVFGSKEKPGFDQLVFERAIANITGQTGADFVDDQAHELRAAHMASLISSRARVGDVEGWERYQQDRSTTTIRYVRLVPSYFADRFAPSDAATVDKWAEGHKSAVDAREASLPKDEERRLLRPRHMLIEAKKDAPADKKAEAKKKAEDLLAKIRAGGDFVAFAKEHSSDPGAKEKGGEYDWTVGTEFGPLLAPALAKLKVGETSLVETDDGFHIFQLLGRFDGRTAIAFPAYREAVGGELATSASEKIAAKLKGKLPVALDDALKAKVEESKKSGRSEADATSQVLADEAKDRVAKVIDEVLIAMGPIEVNAAPKNAPAAAPIDPTKAAPKATDKDGKVVDNTKTPLPAPAWQTDSRKPRVEESAPYNPAGEPVIGLMDQQPIIALAEKLTPEAPLSVPTKVAGDSFIVVLKARHVATREEFDKERGTYLDEIVNKKRTDAIINHVTAVRESLGKELTIYPAYTTEDKKGDPSSDSQQPIETDDQ